MYCPQCRVEYRPGFTRCSDCGVELVEELTSRTRSKGIAVGAIEGAEELRMIWEGDDSQEMVTACSELQHADIPYQVNENVEGRSVRMKVDWNYQINVRAADYAKAREVLGYMDQESEEAIKRAEADGTLELPAADDKPIEDVKGDWNPPGWFPEDATVEVWSGNPKERGSIVEMSLKENRINYRVEMVGEELKTVFVLPEDNARAREIVREIVEGEPPE